MSSIDIISLVTIVLTLTGFFTTVIIDKLRNKK